MSALGAVTSLNLGPARVDELRTELDRTFRQAAQDKQLRLGIEIDSAVQPVIRTDMASVIRALAGGIPSRSCRTYLKRA